MTEVSKEVLTIEQVDNDIKNLAFKIHKETLNQPITCIVAITRGGLYPVSILSQCLDVRDVRTICLQSYNETTQQDISVIYQPDIPDSNQTLFVDDLCDSGKTLQFIKEHYPKSLIAVIYTKDKNKNYLYNFYSKEKKKSSWLVFPWEFPSLKKSTKAFEDFIKAVEGDEKWEPRDISILPWESTTENSNESAKEEKWTDIGSFKAPKYEEKIRVSRKYNPSYNESIDIDKDYISNEGFLLTKEQKKVINWIERKRKRLTLLTGKAGAGKSAIIKELLYRNSTWDICSTTGRSALLVGGCTVDRLFAYDRENNTHFSEFVLSTNMRACGKVIIIDEASMMGKKMFETCYTACIRYNKDLVLVGDWGQAAPVKDDWIFNSNIFFKDVQCIKLTEAHRQTNQEFLEVLDKVRRGICDEQVNTLLSSRILPQLDEDDNSKLVIYSTNAMTSAYNKKKVQKYAEENNQPIVTLISIARNIKEGLPEEKIQFNLDNSPYANGEEVCLGCKVLITKNNHEAGYVNGDTGVLIAMEEMELIVKLDRTNYKVAVSYESTEIRNAKDEVEMKICGFPIKCGYAFTAHKCQGLTIPKVWVDIEDIRRLHSHGLCYVALSRVRNLEDLYISNWNPDAIRCDNITKPYL